MIPPVIDPRTPSPGEREAFQRLRDDADTSDWIVLHSLDIPNHRRQVSGEVDFVVLIPGKGVLCVEVKAHHKIRRQDGLWYFGDDLVGSPRSPFRQASDAMHSLRTRVAARRSGLGNIVFWSAALFPYVVFSDTAEEWHPWQVIDSRIWRSRPLSTALTHVLDEARKFLTEVPSAAWFRPDVPAPTQEQCEQIAAVLRPDFEYFESPESRRQARQEELKKYTEDQYAALDAMERARRVVFDGPAGTGKTLLAIEAARRGSSRGLEVLVVCYNRLLGDWLRRECQGLEGVRSGTLHSYMVQVAGEAPPPKPDEEYWNSSLPDRALAALLEEASADRESIDLLIVDEAQDILVNSYLDVLDLTLRGGLAAGDWRFFSDYTKQSIYLGDRIALEDFLEERAAGALPYVLGTNCRNTPRIATYVSLLGGLKPPYSRVRRPDDGVEPDLHFYSSDEEQASKLCGVLDALWQEGYRGQDVIVLSPLAEGSCAAHMAEPPWRDRLRAIHVSKPGYVSYASIHSFKGMEASAVVVTDITSIGSPEAQSLLYVAITRATDRLVLLVHEDARAEATTVVLGQNWEATG